MDIEDSLNLSGPRCLLRTWAYKASCGLVVGLCVGRDVGAWDRAMEARC